MTRIPIKNRSSIREEAINGVRSVDEGHLHRFWSVDEIELLEKLYPNESIRSIANKLGRPVRAVRYKAHTIGLKKETTPIWSNREIRLLKKMYPDNSPKDIANEPGRNVRAVIRKASQLGFSKKPRLWSKRELDLLIKLYPSRTAQEIAKQIGRPVKVTRLKIFKLGLKKRLRYKDRHRVVSGAREKLCSKCGKWRGESQFNKNRSSKDGLIGWCKECLSAVRKKRRSTAKN